MFKLVSAEYPSEWPALDADVNGRLTQISADKQGSLFAGLLALKCMVTID